MAFTEQEKQILIDAATKGQDKNTALQRVMNFRMGIKKPQPSEPQQSTLNKVAEGVRSATEFVGGGLNEIASQANKALGIDEQGKQMLNKIGEVIQPAVQTYEENIPQPVKDVVTIGALAAPFVPKSVQAVTSIPSKVSKATEKVKETVAPVSNALKTTGETISSMGIRPGVQEAERILQYRADNPFINRVVDNVTGKSKSPTTKAQTATRQGIFGRKQDIGIQSKRAADSIWTKEIQPALDATDDVILRDELFALARKKVAESIEPGKQKAYQNALELLEDEYKGINYYKLGTAQKVKSQLDDFTPSKLFKGQEVANEYAVLKHEMADAIRYKIYDSLKDEGIKQKYLDYANLEDLAKMGIDALTKQKQLGGAGSFTMAMLDKALVPISTASGRFVYKLGDLLTVTSPTKIKTLREHLVNNGVQETEIPKLVGTMPILIESLGLDDSEETTETPKPKNAK